MAAALRQSARTHRHRRIIINALNIGGAAIGDEWWRSAGSRRSGRNENGVKKMAASAAAASKSFSTRIINARVIWRNSAMAAASSKWHQHNNGAASVIGGAHGSAAKTAAAKMARKACASRRNIIGALKLRVKSIAFGGSAFCRHISLSNASKAQRGDKSNNRVRLARQQ